MSRYAITITCSSCSHSAVDDVELDAFAAAPDAQQLSRARRKCSKCGSRRFGVAIEKLLPRWADAFKPEGMPLQFSPGGRRK
jgi:hypothetical protein